MGKEEKHSRMPQIGEAIFCIAYLLFDLIAAVVFFVNADGHTELFLFGILTLVLGGGDAFHLVPRIGFPGRFSCNRMVDRIGLDGIINYHDHILCVAVLCVESPFP